MRPIERRRLVPSRHRLHAYDSRFAQARKSAGAVVGPRRSVAAFPAVAFWTRAEQRRRYVAIAAA